MNSRVGFVLKTNKNTFNASININAISKELIPRTYCIMLFQPRHIIKIYSDKNDYNWNHRLCLLLFDVNKQQFVNMDKILLDKLLLDNINFYAKYYIKK